MTPTDTKNEPEATQRSPQRQESAQDDAGYQASYIDVHGIRRQTLDRATVAEMREDAADPAETPPWKFTMYSAPLLCDSHDALQAKCAALTARLAAVEQERAAVRAGVMELLEYTRHRVPCPQFNNVSMLGCTCGLWAVLERALPKDPPDGR